MILINDAKYSCSECIRGHRSSLCRHHMRPLLQVRSKGRPNLLFPQGNKDYRIAVFAQEVKDGDAQKKCKDTPVIILKTSAKHIIKLSNGEIVGPYVAETEGVMKKAVGPGDFVNTTSCCPTGVARIKGCGCNQSKVSKKKILRSFLDKRMAARDKVAKAIDAQKAMDLQLDTAVPQLNTPDSSICESVEQKSCCKSKAKSEPLDLDGTSYTPFAYPELEVPALDCGILKQEQLPESNVTNQEFRAIAVPSCTIPGTCSCSADCSCASCVVHRGPKKEQYSLDMLNNDSQFGSNLVLTSRQSTNAGLAASDMDPYSAYLSQIIGCNVEEPVPDPVQSTQSKCSCAADSCFCSNCETHSIIDGYRLDDIFGSHNPVG